MTKKTLIIFLVLLAIFLALRLPGVSLPYHQDEFKLVNALSRGGEGMWQYFSYHPPLQGFLLWTGYLAFGPDHLRLLPILFSLAAAIVLFLIVKKRSGESAALWALFLYTICFYSLFSSLMIDVDGAIIPFFFLAAIWFYDQCRHEPNHQVSSWLGLGLVLGLGFLTKLSFILVLGALLLDLLWHYWAKIKFWQIVITVIVGTSLVSLVWLLPGHTFEHARSFFHLGGRDYTQIIVQALKAIFYLSPLLLVPILFVRSETFRQTRIFFVYLALGLIFYFILFDFSHGALDKYLMFAVAPLSIIVGTIIGRNIIGGATSTKQINWGVVAGLVLGLGLVWINFLPHQVLPLYPKGEWFSHVLHLQWNFLNPFTGGSGPMGFYVSFLFIVLAFIISFVLGLVALVRRSWRGGVVVALITVGLVYNGVLAEELLWGQINGSAPKLLHQAVAYIGETKEITNVLTYNDSGAWDLQQVGKYGGRFYATPQFEVSLKQRFADQVALYGGYFLVIDIPHINPQSFYIDFLSHCPAVFTARDGQISATVYSCKQ